MEKGTISYEIVSFSDSQKLVNLGGVYAKGNTNVEESVKIISRMNWADVQLIICATEVLREAGFKYIHLFSPYILGGRSDRKFQLGSVNYLKKVICPLINSLKFESVTVLDPHSNCLEMGLEHFKKASNAEVVEWALVDILDELSGSSKDLVWLIPDKGATEKAYSTAKEIGYTSHILECGKKRDPKSGQIVETTISHGAIFEHEDICIIVDDICDGGRTFIELAKAAKKRGAEKMYLVVTHGIFSQGFNLLFDYFDAIYCTNSVYDLENPTGIWHEIAGHKKMSRLKQLNVL